MTTAPTIVPSWIGGREESGSSTFSVIDPSKGEPCWETASVSEQDAIRATEAAEAAFPAWSATKPIARQAILFKAATLMEERAEELVSFMSAEMGADYWTGRHFILPLAIQMMRDIAGRIPTVCGTVPVVQRDGQSAMVWKEPYGVILGIVPW
jgi:acyl-CoA reductase-like NAD-dependent aldehyde dehydrogenase